MNSRTLTSLLNHCENHVVTVCMFAISAFIASFVISRCLSKHYSRRPHYHMPPGPPVWPVLGNLPAILSGGQPHLSLARLAREYGPIMLVSLGPFSKALVLSSSEVVKEVLVKNADVTSDRRIPPLLGYAFSTKGSVIWENGTASKAHRRFILTAFRKCLGPSALFHETLSNSLIHLRRALLNRCAGFCQLNPRTEITAAVSEVICSLCFGHCLDVRSDHKISVVMRAMHDFSSCLSGISLAHIFPPLYYTPLYGKLRRNIMQLKSFLKDVVREHQAIRKNRKGSSDCSEATPSDFTDHYLTEIKDSKYRGKIEIETDDIWRVMFDLLGAGTETTSETLLWGILFLCLYPKIQLQVQSEIDSNIKLDNADDVITFDKCASLPFTQATVFELLRCACVAPLSLPRIASGDVTVKGYTIPRGTEIWVNEWAINRDANVWKNPTEFNPARFLDETGNVDRKVKEAVIAFGEGRRVCLGRNLAEIKLFTFLSNLLRWFTFSFPKDCGTLPDVNGGNFGLVYSPPAFDVIITPRLPITEGQ